MNLEWKKIEEFPEKNVKIQGSLLLLQKNSIEELKKQNVILKEKKEKMETYLEKTFGNKMELINKFEELQESYKKINEDNDKLNELIKEKDFKIKNLTENNENFEFKENILKENKDDLNIQISKLKKEIIVKEDLFKDIKQNYESKIQLKDDQLKDFKQNLETKIQLKEDEINNLKRQQETEIHELKNQLDEKSKSILNFQPNLDQLIKEKEELNNNFIKEKKNLKNEILQLEEQSSKFNERTSNLKNEHSQQVRKLKDQLNKYKDTPPINMKLFMDCIRKINQSQFEIIEVLFNIIQRPGLKTTINEINKSCKIPIILLKTRTLKTLENKNLISFNDDIISLISP